MQKQKLEQMIILVSPRKTGTHLITSWLGQKFAYKGRLQIGSSEPGYYSLGNTFHTSFKSFYQNLDREDFSGGALLPLKACLGITVCRHPADTLLSHLEYSFKNHNTAYSNFANKDILEMSNIYENFFESLYEYTSWSQLSNFLTVDFESLTNAVKNSDLGNNNALLALSDNMDLPLEGSVFGAGHTFNKGKIGRGIEFIEKNCPEIFDDQYYGKICEFFGYPPRSSGTPTNVNQLNKRGVEVQDTRPTNEPRLVEENFCDYRIIYYNGMLYGVSHDSNFIELLQQGEIKIKAKSLDEAKAKIGGLTASDRPQSNRQSASQGIKSWIRKL